MFKSIIAFILMLAVTLNAAETKKYSEQELDTMLAPIALYPDALLSQILMASTYNEQLQEAINYSQINPEEKGDAAVKKVQDKDWDASVSSLVAFPQVLEMLDKDPAWASDLGDAFLNQSESMMDRVQYLRKKAEDAGNLKTSEEQTVKTEDQNGTKAIVVAPVTQTVYVPVYNPTYVYGPWMYPAYPPYYYYPPHYNPMPGFIFGFTAGIIVSNAMWGGFGWHSRSVHINVNRYNNINVNKISGNGNTVNWKNKNQHSGNKLNTKDRQRAKAKNSMKNKGINPSLDKSKLSGASGDKMRKSIDSGKFSSRSNAFSGVNKPNRSKLEGSRGGFSRENRTGSFGSSHNRSSFSGSSRGGSRGGFGGGRGRR